MSSVSASSSSATRPATAAAPSQVARRRAATLPPVPPFHDGSAAAPPAAAAAAAASANATTMRTPAASASSSSSTAMVLSGSKAAAHSTSSSSLLHSSGNASHNASSAAFFSTFFCPLVFYRQMDLRRRSGLCGGGSAHSSGASAAASSAAQIHAPIFLNRTLRYDAAESSVARRDARVLAAIEWTRASKAAEAARMRAAERERRQRKKQRRALHAADPAESAELAAAATAAAVELPFAAASVSEPYISPSDLLGVKLAVAAAAAAASKSGTAAAPDAAASLNAAAQFDRSRVSKRLQITLEQIVFFGNPIVPSATSSAAAGSHDAASTAAATPTPPVLSAAQYQHLHAAAPVTLDASAHLCSSPLSAPPSAASRSSRVEAVLGLRLEKDRAAAEPAGQVGLRYTSVPASSASAASSDPKSATAAASAAPVPILFSSVNFFTHPSALPPRAVSITPTASAAGQRRYRNLPHPPALEDRELEDAATTFVPSASSSAWSVRIMLSPAASASSSLASSHSAASRKHLNKGPRIHALTASNNARAADCLADTTSALIRGSVASASSQQQYPRKIAASTGSTHHAASSSAVNPASSSLGGYFAPASSHSAHHTSLLDSSSADAAASLPDALQPCRVPRVASLAPGSFLVHIPLLRPHRRFSRRSSSAAPAAAAAMEWVEDCGVRAHILASPSTAPASADSARHDGSTPAQSLGGDVIVGSCVVQLRWIYKLHARAVIPRPILRTKVPRAIQPASTSAPTAAAATQIEGADASVPTSAPSAATPVMLTWRFLYSAPSDATAGSSTPDAAAAAAGSKLDAASNQFFLEPSGSSADASSAPSVTQAGYWDAIPGCAPIPLPLPGHVAASSVEHTVDFSCAFCSMRGADSVGSSDASSAAASTVRRRSPLLRDFTALVRHLESSHSEFLSFQYGLPKRAQMGLAGEDSAALSADTMANSTASSPAPPLDASLSKEVMTYEIVVRAKETCGRLKAIVAPPSEGAPAAAAMMMAGLPAAPSVASAGGPSAQQSAPYVAADTPHSYFCFFGLRYAPSPYALALHSQKSGSGSLTNSYAKKSAVAAGNSTQELGEEAALTVTRNRLGTDGSEPAAPSIKDLTARGSARNKPHTKPSRAQAHHPDHPLAPASLSVAAAACLASNPALYSRQWFHASSGLPLALCELGYDSDSQGGAGAGTGGSGAGGVDEEWLISAAHRHLDEFAAEDVSYSEKQFMKVWNEFVLRRSSTDPMSGGGGAGPIYADYLFPRVCADFARVVRPLFRRLLGLRTGFLLHLMTSWEFGLLSFPEIEACMRIADDHSDEEEDERANGETAAAAAAAKDRASRRAQQLAWMSVHAPARARQYRAELDAAGGFPLRERGASAGLGPLALLHKDSATGATAQSAPRAQERAAAEKRKRAASPDDSTAANAAATAAAAAAPPRSARLREREAISELEAAKEAARQKKRDRRAARDCGSRYRNKKGLKTLSSSTSSSGSGSGSGSDEDENDDDAGEDDGADSSADDSPSSSPLVRKDRRDGVQRAKAARRLHRRQRSASGAAGTVASASASAAATPMDVDDDDDDAAAAADAAAEEEDDDGVERKVAPTPRGLCHPSASTSSGAAGSVDANKKRKQSESSSQLASSSSSSAVLAAASSSSSSARKNSPGGLLPPPPPSRSHTHAAAAISSSPTSNEAKRRRAADKA